MGVAPRETIIIIVSRGATPTSAKRERGSGYKPMTGIVIVSNVAELPIAIDYEEPIVTVESMIHH